MAENIKVENRVIVDAPDESTGRAVDDFIGRQYRYDKVADSVHADRTETVDVGSQGNPLCFFRFDGQDKNGKAILEPGEKRERWLARHMMTRSSWRAMAGVVNKRIVCSDPNCRPKVKTDEVDPATGRNIWIADPASPAVSNNCLHCTAVWMMQQAAEEFLAAYLAETVDDDGVIS